MKEMVAGLEIHVELSTKSKIFCACSTAFGAKPNTHCCPVCTGQPGALPVLNKAVVEYAVRAGLALNSRINTRTHLDRKNYFYPDLPKAYQISQYDEPLCEGGYIELDSGKKIRLKRIHIEEDAGKLVHEKGFTYIDYNRGGVPLIEIVSLPDISSSAEAREFVEKMQLIMRYIGVSDCKMQEGSLRCDVNISVKEGDGPLNIHTEIKNLNSVSFMCEAMDFEFSRQCDVLAAGGKVEKATLRFDTSTGETYPMRTKEDENDYRYFPEPDVPVIEIEPSLLEGIKDSLPELPSIKINRYINDFGIKAQNAELVCRYHKVAAFVEGAIAEGASPKNAVNFTLGTIFSTLGTEEGKELFEIKTTASQFAALIKLLDTGKINSSMASSALVKMLDTGKDFTEFIKADDMHGISEGDLIDICRKVVEENAGTVGEIKGGKTKAMGALLGAVARATKGKADMKKAEEIVKELISV
ncbi:MAG: Asp-tRNA(Asn)/Glu-tRNA(Gln) amidotransferase subunit GatB [Clostridia bacterium]|nr:Asp-tRNA(Asn)/Glu-tRNA(Gln) amidotransferase subunit GatB [Clostridia bacterium]